MTLIIELSLLLSAILGILLAAGSFDLFKKERTHTSKPDYFKIYQLEQELGIREALTRGEIRAFQFHEKDSCEYVDGQIGPRTLNALVDTGLFWKTKEDFQALRELYKNELNLQHAARMQTAQSPHPLGSLCSDAYNVNCGCGYHPATKQNNRCACGYTYECAIHCGNGHETGDCPSPKLLHGPAVFPQVQSNNFDYTLWLERINIDDSNF